MKGTIIFLSSVISFLQINAQVVANKKVFTTTTKTTFLIFPTDVKFFDTGSDEIGVTTTDNTRILRMKAAKINFKETNLTVMCEGDQIYSFIINYAVNPDTLNYLLKGEATIPTRKAKFNSINVAEVKDKVTDTTFKSEIEQVLKLAKGQKMLAGEKKEGIIMALTGIYVKDNDLYFALELNNLSRIDYDINFIKFLVKGKKKLKQSSVQENEQMAVAQFPDLKVLKEGKPINVVYVFNKFTVPTSKKLSIEMWDASGERNITIDLNGSEIFKAKSL